LSTQPLPELTSEQLKFAGAVQPAGQVVPEIANPVIGKPSLEVKVMLSVCVVPTRAVSVPDTAAVATTVSRVPVN
jgi:hypothetical protein